jgi:hypothetical protein
MATWNLNFYPFFVCELRAATDFTIIKSPRSLAVSLPFAVAVVCSLTRDENPRWIRFYFGFDIFSSPRFKPIFSICLLNVKFTLFGSRDCTNSYSRWKSVRSGKIRAKVVDFKQRNANSKSPYSWWLALEVLPRTRESLVLLAGEVSKSA